jgi:hypothetical protein
MLRLPVAVALVLGLAITAADAAARAPAEKRGSR